MKIGIDLGGSHIAIGVVDKEGKIIEKIETSISRIQREKLQNTIENNIEINVNQLIKKYNIDMVGISVPGTLNSNTIIKSVNLGLENYPIIEKLQEKINIPIQIKNDAKCAAIAESKYGCLRNYNRSIFLTLGTGIGGAVIIDEKLLNTGNLPGCEFGHIIIEKDGLPCNCGKNGCFEKYASMKIFKDNLRKSLNLSNDTHGQEIFDLIYRNMKLETETKESILIKKLVSEYIKNLSIGISNLINIFEPEVVGIGGSFVFFKEIFLEELNNQLINTDLLFNKRNNIEIKTAVLGNDAGIIGAIEN